MHRILPPLCGLLMIFCGLAGASAAESPSQQLVLRDGSVIVGTLESLADGVYTLQSATLGRIEVPASQVRMFRAVGESNRATDGPDRTGATSSGPGDSQSGVSALRDLMAQDPGVLERILALTESPAMREALADPDLLRRVRNGDLDALAQDPRILELMRDPIVRDLTTRVAPAATRPD